MIQRVVLAALLLASVVTAGCEGPSDPAPVATVPQPSGDGRLVLVSGRDDHGMLAMERVPVYDVPEGDQVVASIRDGTLARVVEIDNQWLQVQTVEGARATGWVNDFYLRGEARLVGPPPSCSVRVRGLRRPGGTLVVVRRIEDVRTLVETVTRPRIRGWVPRSHLQELPPQGDTCGSAHPDDRHAH